MKPDIDARTLEALKAAANTDNGQLVRTRAGFAAPGLDHAIHYRTVSALVQRGLLSYVGRGKAQITAAGRAVLFRMEQRQ